MDDRNARGIFHSSMIELALLGLPVPVLVISITRLRRYNTLPGE
jgi:hypothetical protein